MREDLQASHKAVANWLDIFERLYSIFRVPPFGSSKIRAVKKEQKHFPDCAAWQISAIGEKNYSNALGACVCPATEFLSALV